MNNSTSKFDLPLPLYFSLLDSNLMMATNRSFEDINPYSKTNELRRKWKRTEERLMNSAGVLEGEEEAGGFYVKGGSSC